MEKRYHDALAWFWDHRRVYPLTVWSVLTEVTAEAEKWKAAFDSRPHPSLPSLPPEPAWYGRVDPRTMLALAVNPAILGYLGCTETDLTKRPFTDFVMEQNRPLIRGIIREAASTGMEAVAFLYDRDGTPMIFTATRSTHGDRVEVEVIGRPAAYRLRQVQLVGEA